MSPTLPNISPLKIYLTKNTTLFEIQGRLPLLSHSNIKTAFMQHMASLKKNRLHIYLTYPI